jgi:hypothetical protein
LLVAQRVELSPKAVDKYVDTNCGAAKNRLVCWLFKTLEKIQANHNVYINHAVEKVKKSPASLRHANIPLDKQILYTVHNSQKQNFLESTV